MKKKLLFATLIFTIFALAQTSQIVSVLGAEYDEDVTLDILGSAPELSAISLTDSSDVVTTTIDPEATYKFKFTVSHANTLDYLTDIVVDVYFGSVTTDDIRSCYTFTWTEGLGSTDFISSPSGYEVSSVTPTDVQEASGSFGFELHFNLDGIAVPSGDTATWHIDVTVTDDGAGTDSDTNTLFDVMKYQSSMVSTSSIAFGTAVPGGDLDEQQVTVTLTTNTQVDINVQGADLIDGSNSIPITQFSASDDSSGSPTAYTLSTSYTTVYDDYVAVPDAINTGVTGYTDAGDLLVGFDGTVPAVQAVGNYGATWKILLDQSSVTPS